MAKNTKKVNFNLQDWRKNEGPTKSTIKPITKMPKPTSPPPPQKPATTRKK